MPRLPQECRCRGLRNDERKLICGNYILQHYDPPWSMAIASPHRGLIATSACLFRQHPAAVIGPRANIIEVKRSSEFLTKTKNVHAEGAVMFARRKSIETQTPQSGLGCA